MSKDEASVSLDQVLTALQRGELAARPLQAVHIDPRRARKLKKYNPDTGEVTGEIGSNEALARLLDDARVRHQELEAIDRKEAQKAWDVVHERRRMGIPDSCFECKVTLSMHPMATRKRNRKAVPVFMCRICRARNLAGLLMTTTEDRRRGGINRAANLTPEQRSEIGRQLHDATPEQLSDRARKANASRTPEQRSAAARKSAATRRAKAANG